MRKIDKAFAEQQFKIYKSTFHDSFLGLSAIRDYAKDDNRQGDVDSGPVIFEIGSAATIVGMQTFALYGNDETSIKIRNALEAVAFPTETNERKVYLFGLMPMTDAFITWGHSVQSVSAGNKPYFLAFHLYSALAIINNFNVPVIAMEVEDLIPNGRVHENQLAWEEPGKRLMPPTAILTTVTTEMHNFASG